MNPTKKSILFIHPPHHLKSSNLQEDTRAFISPVQLEMTTAYHDVPVASPLGSVLTKKKDSTINGILPTYKYRCFSIDKAVSKKDIDAFIIRIFQAIDAIKPDVIFFQMPFEADETLFRVLEAISKRFNIIMGITLMIKGKQKTFDLPGKYLELPRLGLIQWMISHPENHVDTRPLWQISRKGIWNHFIVDPKEKSFELTDLVSFILSNPNIAHSHDMYSTVMAGQKAHGSGTFTFFNADIPYSTVAPLPGIPLWQFLDDPALILLYLNHHTQKELFPVRVRTDGCTAFSLGKKIQFYFQKPEDLSPGYMDEICKMVEAGGSVATKWVRYNLERAFLIAYAMEHDVIVGNSSLKRPRKPFIERINKISNMDFTHFLERGYTSVRPEYRALGVGAKLLEGLTIRAGDHKIFSIISEDNTATQKIAIRNKTRKVVTYYSEQMGKSAGIWMPESMIDDKRS